MNAIGTLVTLNEDHHVHSTFSQDAVSTMEENICVAQNRGLRAICLVDHVRRDTPWLAEFISAVDAVRPVRGLEVFSGIEAKILDRSGRLDIPADSEGVDVVLIADHQFPGDTGPVHPAEVRRLMAEGEVTAPEVIDCLIEATANALRRTPRPQLAHLFSLLPKIGLDECTVPASALANLARHAKDVGARVEVNEKWACPSARAVRVFADAGVTLVASTDSHNSGNIGVYAGVERILADASSNSAL